MMAEELESPGDPETPTPSLQRRVILLVVALLAVLLVVLGVTIDVSLGLQARRNLHDLLLAATSRADALASVGTSPELIAAEINGGSARRAGDSRRCYLRDPTSAPTPPRVCRPGAALRPDSPGGTRVMAPAAASLHLGPPPDHCRMYRHGGGTHLAGWFATILVADTTRPLK